MVILLLAVCSFFLCANAMSFRKFSMSFAQQIKGPSLESPDCLKLDGL